MPDVVEPSVTPLESDASPSALHKRFQADFRPRPWIYWADFLTSAAVGWGLFAASLQVPAGSAIYALLSLGAVLGLLRSALFIHELAHLQPHDVRGFDVGWNLLFGVPALAPSLMYVGSHNDHHRRTGFATAEDPEYVSMTSWGRLRLVGFVLSGMAVPLLLTLRWGLVAPVGRLVPPLHRFAVERWSSLVINPDYRRPLPRGRAAKRFAIQETAAMLWVWAVTAAVALGFVPVAWVLQFWLVAGGVWTLNQARTLAAHYYENEGEPVDTLGQLLDSINLDTTSPFTLLMAPVGLRFHALHHYLPGLPYHSLGRVHRALLRELPPEAPYRRTVVSSLEEALQAIWQRTASGPPPRLVPDERGARGL